MPVDSGGVGISIVLPELDSVFDLWASEPCPQRLFLQNGELDFSHVEPGAVFGRVVPLKALDQTARFLGSKRLLKRGDFVGVEVVGDQNNHLGIGIDVVGYKADKVGKVNGGAPLSDLSGAASGQRFHRSEDVGRALALVLVILAGRLGGLGRQGAVRCGMKLFAGLVHAHNRAFGVVGPSVDFQHVFHFGYEVGAWFRQTPRLDLPRLERVFLSRTPT